MEPRPDVQGPGVCTYLPTNADCFLWGSKCQSLQHAKAQSCSPQAIERAAASASEVLPARVCRKTLCITRVPAELGGGD